MKATKCIASNAIGCVDNGRSRKPSILTATCRAAVKPPVGYSISLLELAWLTQWIGWFARKVPSGACLDVRGINRQTERDIERKTLPSHSIHLPNSLNKVTYSAILGESNFPCERQNGRETTGLLLDALENCRRKH